jgi:hypothetical protein
MIRLLSAVVVLLATTGCVADPAVSHDVAYCCGPPGTVLTTYSLSLTAVPGFLVPQLRGELVAALAARGLRLSDVSPDAWVTLSYSESYPDADRPFVNDGFADPLASGDQRQFDAHVTLAIRRAADGADVLRGVVSREHTVSVGEYNHDKARHAIRRGFDALLKRLPKT